jgi:hypothetical protein
VVPAGAMPGRQGRMSGIPPAAQIPRRAAFVLDGRPGTTAAGRGVVRPRRMVRFARLMHRRGRVLGGPAVRAASGGNLSLTRLPLTVVPTPSLSGG